MVCELCKTNFPSLVTFGNHKVHLLDIPRPDSPYLLLETIPAEPEESTTIYVILLSNKKLIKIVYIYIYCRGEDTNAILR